MCTPVTTDACAEGCEREEQEEEEVFEIGDSHFKAQCQRQRYQTACLQETTRQFLKRLHARVKGAQTGAAAAAASSAFLLQ